MCRVRTTRCAALALGLALLSPGARGEDSITAANEAILREAGFRYDGPALLEFFRSRTLSPKQLDRLRAAVRGLGAPSFAIRERASAELLEAGGPVLPLLQRAAADPDLEVARRARRCLEGIHQRSEANLALAAAQLLAVRRPAGAAEVILNYLPFAADPAVVEELLPTLGVVGLRGTWADPALVRALRDGSPTQRAAAARVLGRSREARHQALVRPLLTDADPEVRWCAAEALLLSGDKRALPALLLLLSEAPPEVAGQAEGLLYRLAGDQAPPVGLGTSAEERQKCRRAWEGWWRDRGAALDLARVDLGRGPLGLVLVVALNGYGGNGRVWELGPDHKLRWELGDVGGPFDAQVLPGHRLLVAEYNGRRVTERDFKGRVLWEYSLDHGALCCQRLPGGTTLITTNYDIREVTRAGHSVFSFADPRANIFSAQKLANGHFLYGTYDGWMVELDRTGKERKRFPIIRPNRGLVTVEVLPGGRLLMARTSEGHVVELDSTGRVVWRCAVDRPTTAVRLPNGHTFVGSHATNRLVEVDRRGKVVWEQSADGQIFRVHVR